MTGVIIGRFMPPHNGHLFLIDFARHVVDRLYILVCTLSHEPVAGELRHRWMAELAPTCEVVHITEEIPAARRGESGATAIWARAVREAVPEAITHVFASEEYGWELAAELGARYVPVDPERSNIPVSATMVRDDPWRVWRYIPAPVRPYYLRHVGVLDNRLLADSLAEELSTVVVHPYGEFWRGVAAGARGRIGLGDESVVARAEHAAAEALARQANRILVHDLRSAAPLPPLDLLVAWEDAAHAVGFRGGALLSPSHARRDEVLAALTPPGDAPTVRM